MGIDKGLGNGDRIAIIDGMVFQWGNVDYDQGTFEPLAPKDQFWLVEHHSYAKDSVWHGTEQSVRDFLDGLPATRHCVVDQYSQQEWRALSDQERSRILSVDRPNAVAKIGAESRKNKQKKKPAEFVSEVRHAIEAILQKHIVPYCHWDDPEIGEQIELILADALARYKAELHPADPLPTDDPAARLKPAVEYPGSERSTMLLEIEELLRDLPSVSDEGRDDEPF